MWPRPQSWSISTVTIMMSDDMIDIGNILQQGSKATGHHIAKQWAAELVVVLKIPEPCSDTSTWICKTSKLFNVATGKAALDSLMTQLEFVLAHHLEVPIV